MITIYDRCGFYNFLRCEAAPKTYWLSSHDLSTIWGYCGIIGAEDHEPPNENVLYKYIQITPCAVKQLQSLREKYSSYLSYREEKELGYAEKQILEADGKYLGIIR